MKEPEAPAIYAEIATARTVHWMVAYDGRRYDFTAAPRITTKLTHFAYTVGVAVTDLIDAAIEARRTGDPINADDPDVRAAIASANPSDVFEDLELPGFAALPAVDDDAEEIDEDELDELEDELDDDAEPEHRRRFTETGDPVVDFTLDAADVVIPDGPTTDAPTGWAEVMGQQILGGNGAGSGGSNGSNGDDPELPPTPSFRLRIRGRMKKAATATPLEGTTPMQAIEAALTLEKLPKDAVIEWPRSELPRLACLDVDWHGIEPPSAAALEAMLAKLSPWPALWISHGGGLHLIFCALQGFAADELAAAAGLALLERYPAGSRPEVEVLPRSAHPRAKRKGKRAGEVIRMEQSVDRMLAGWRAKQLIGIDDDAVNDWLADHGFEIGGRYGHERCPFDARKTSKGGDPVVVGDDGVHCFVCASKGHPSGGRASYGRLVGTFRNSRVLDAAQGFIYFEQAKHLLREEYPHVPPALFEPAWACFLKLVHSPDDPRIGKAMTHFYVIRGAGNLWLDAETLNPVSPRVDAKVTQLMPSATYVGVDKKGLPAIKVSARLHDLHRTNQSIPGFPVVVPVRGARLWGQHQRYPGREVRTVVPSKRPDEITPRYVPPSRRMDIEAAWEFLEESYPGVDRNYVELLLAARGWAESGGGPVPMLIVTGPTGAAKTTTVMLAATIAGDTCAGVKEQDRAKFAESLGERCARCGFVLLDEFAKSVNPRKARMLFDLLLDIGREYTYRRLYVGPVTASLNSVLVVTNNVFPQDVRQNAQLGRRLVSVELHRRAPAAWENTCGTGDVRFWRTVQQNADVCDAIMSHVIDEHFSEGQCDDGWLGSVRRCGFDLLEATRSGSAGVSIDDSVRELFEAICDDDAPTAPNRWRGRGWRVLKLDGTGDIERCWRNLCDDASTMDGFAASMRIAELDLAALLGASDPVRLELSRHGRALGMRFVCGTTRGRGLGDINSEIDTHYESMEHDDADDEFEVAVAGDLVLDV
jgi:hypothetical protein